VREKGRSDFCWEGEWPMRWWCDRWSVWHVWCCDWLREWILLLSGFRLWKRWGELIYR
jgi:hypothetical protein